MLPHTKINLTR